MNCLNCENNSEEKPQFIEIIDIDGSIKFRCPKCKLIFELIET